MIKLLKVFIQIAVIAWFILALPLAQNAVQAGGNVSITRTFYVAEDSTLDNQNVNTQHYNYGGRTEVLVTSKDIRRPILRTNFGSNIPTSSNVSSATLYLYYYSGSTGVKDPVGLTYYVDRLTETDWVEGTSNGVIETGAVDWFHRQHDTLSWTAEGGTYITTGEGSGTVPAAYGWMQFNVTALVQYAITNGVNAEWLIRDPSTGTNFNANFYSSEGTNVPYVSIIFTAPWESYQTAARTTVWGALGILPDRSSYHRMGRLWY